MSRYISDFNVDKPIDIVSIMVDDFVYHNQFRRADWNGEMVYSSTDSYGTERFFKWSYAGGVFHIEAWIKGLGGGEADLSGVYKSKSRMEYAREIEKLKNKITFTTYEGFGGGHMGSDPIHDDEDHDDEDNHTVWGQDTLWQNDVLKDGSAGYTRNTEYNTAPVEDEPRESKALINYAAFLLSMSALGIAMNVDPTFPYAAIGSFFCVILTFLCVKFGKSNPIPAIFAIMAAIVDIVNVLQFLHM